MAEKKFTVIFKGGNTRTVYAARGDEEEEEDGYIFFRAPNGEIIALFHKSAVAQWYEDV